MLKTSDRQRRQNPSENGRNLRLFGVLLIIAMLSGVFGAVYASIFYADLNGLHMRRGFLTGFSVAILTGGFELFVVRSFGRSWIRRLPFLAALFLRILIITTLIRLALIGNDLFANYMMGNGFTLNRGEEGEFANEVRDTLVSFAIVVIVVAFAQLSSLIGFRRFLDLLLGRYFRPIREERAFLFVDLKNSTGLARELGDVRFHEFLSQFFRVADRAIVHHGGEIVSYVGDAVIVTWPLEDDGTENARSVEALKAISQSLEEVKLDFEAEFGHSPDFRAALHGGSVVVGECGDSRRQVTFLGDVVNTTARIEAQTKQEDINFLASASVLRRMDLASDISLRDCGEFALKGIGEPIELVQLQFSQAD